MSTPQLREAHSRITARTQQGWVVADRLYRPAMLVTADIVGTVADLTFAGLDARQLPDIGAVDLLLLGTGAEFHSANPNFLQSALARGWRVEAMDSAAAARTFNVLVAEDRLVAALLF